MSPDCTALAYATELSERTLAATAALIGAATFALISDIAARSGSSSPASWLSSSCVSCLYSCDLPPMCIHSFSLVRLGDVRRLLGVGDRGRVVAECIQRDGCV